MTKKSDPVDQIRSTVDGLVAEITPTVDTVATDLPKAMAGPRVTPAVENAIGRLRAALDRFTTASEQLLEALPATPPPPGSPAETPTGATPAGHRHSSRSDTDASGTNHRRARRRDRHRSDRGGTDG